MQRRAKRSILLAALCVVASLVIGGVDRTLHLALVPHTWCEHGEAVHEGHDDLDVGRTAARESSPRPDLPAAGQGHGHGNGHDHCTWGAVQSATVPAVQRDLGATLLRWQLIDDASALTDACTSIPLLQLAPKMSPPAAV